MSSDLTNTSKLSSLRYSIPALDHVVTVHLPQSEVVQTMLSPSSTHRIIDIPLGSKWSPGSHWHENYVEHIKILRGEANVWINSQLFHLRIGDEVTFEAYDVHNFCRTEVGRGEELLIEEWTENEDGTKELFFRNAFSIVYDAEIFGGFLWAFLRFVYVCAHLDNFIAFCPPSTPRVIQRAVTSVGFNIVLVIGKMAGWKSWYTKYTPRHLQGNAEKLIKKI